MSIIIDTSDNILAFISTVKYYAITGTTNRDLGKSLGLLVFLKLKQMYSQVFYWQEPAARHQKALDNFYAAFPQAKEPVFIAQDNAKEFFLSIVSAI